MLLKLEHLFDLILEQSLKFNYPAAPAKCWHIPHVARTEEEENELYSEAWELSHIVTNIKH